MFELKGVNVALVTPFSKDSIDENALRTLISHCRSQGVHGIVPCGSSGEFINMTLQSWRESWG